MAARPSSDAKIARRVVDLQQRLTEAEDTLNAIRSGAVDALVVRTPRGEQLFTLKGADQTYRALVEAMSEGAVTLKRGIISYCNNRFAEMVRMPMEKVFGASIYALVQSDNFSRLVRRLEKGIQAQGSTEASLIAADGRRVPSLLSAARFYSEGNAAIGVVVTDITDRKESEKAREELSRRIINAQEQERQRVARDLHDSVSQLLASVKYRLNTVLDQNPGGNESLRQILEMIERAVSEVRVISQNLRPSELDDLGLIAALRSLTHAFEKRSGVTAAFRPQTRGCPLPMPEDVELTLYRIAQEALNNVEKHSRATRVDLLLKCTRTAAQLTIYDNGKGFRNAAARRRESGWGLANMRERAALLGGTFRPDSHPGAGTTIVVSLPLPPRKKPTNRKNR
jgi:PAS domain S-box-containing protein